MAEKKRAFRSEDSYAFERVARDAVEPFLALRGFTGIEDVRKKVGQGQSQVVRAISPAGQPVSMRVRLCWRRDGHSRTGHLYSAAQLSAHTIGGDWEATLSRIAERDASEGVSHTLFFQRDSRSEVYALLFPSSELPKLWHAQFKESEEQIRKGSTGRHHKNHAANGDSPTIWLQDDRSEGGKEVAKLAWKWPGALDLMQFPQIEPSLRAKYWRVFDAVKALRRPVSVAEVTQWLEANRPGFDYSDTRENLTLLTVNDANRRHYDRSRKQFRTDMGHPRDLLFRSSDGGGVLFQIYVPTEHGVFDLKSDAAGYWTVLHFGASDTASALAVNDAEQEDAGESISSTEDARNYVMRAIAARRGQREFRDALIQAYDGKCAVTACQTVSVLEAAHIVPYLGLHTQRTDNGLLLRSDIHTLFDLGLLWIDDEMLVGIAESLQGSEYSKFEGKAIALPAKRSDRPHPDHLAAHRRNRVVTRDAAPDPISGSGP